MAESKIEKYLRNSGTAEHIINIFKAAASLNPASGAIASLISDYIPNQRQLKLEDFTKSVADDLNRFKDEVNEDYIKTDEFAFIFEKCFKGAMENYQTEKIAAFKAVLINSLRKNQLTQNEKEFFLSLIDRLSLVHIRVLWFMAQPHEYLDSRGIPRTNVEGSFSQFFPRVMPDVSLDLIKLAFQDLNSYGFINTDKSIFGTMTASGGYDLLGHRVTKTGDAFIDFISL
jgi:hypothetical protein